MMIRILVFAQAFLTFVAFVLAGIQINYLMEKSEQPHSKLPSQELLYRVESDQFVKDINSFFMSAKEFLNTQGQGCGSYPILHVFVNGMEYNPHKIIENLLQFIDAKKRCEGVFEK